MNFEELNHLIHNSPVDVIFDVSRGPEFSEQVQRLLFLCGAYWIACVKSRDQSIIAPYSAAIWVDAANRDKFGVPTLTHSGMDYVHNKMASNPEQYRLVTPEELEPLLGLSNDFGWSVAARVRAALKAHLFPDS